MSNLTKNNGAQNQEWSPDGYGRRTYTQETINGLSSYLGAPRAITRNPADNVNWTSKDIEAAFGSGEIRNVQLTRIINEAIIKETGWWFFLAPPKKVEMTQTIKIFQANTTSAKFVPEGGPFETVSYSESTITSRLQRAVLGGTIMMGWLAQKESSPYLAAQFRQVRTGFYILARLCVGSAVTQAKDRYYMTQSQTGVSGQAIMAVIREQVQSFACLQKSPNSFEKLNHTSVEILDRGGLTANMCVLPYGTLLRLSQRNEKVKQYISGQVASVNLALGAKALIGMFPGMTIFEDPETHANNLPRATISTLEARTQVGEVNIITNEYYNPHSHRSPGKTSLARAIYDHSANGWTPCTLTDIVEKNLDLRWNLSNDRLCYEHQAFLDRLDEVKSQLTLKSLGTYIDPFYWYSEQAANTPGIKHKGFFVIEQWGDVDEKALSTQSFINMGKNAKHKMLSELKEEDFTKIEALRDLADLLSNVPDILGDDVLQAYMAAIAHGMKGDRNNKYLETNSFGVPNAPKFVKIDKGNTQDGMKIGNEVVLSEKTDDGEIKKTRKVTYVSAKTYKELDELRLGEDSEYGPVLGFPDKPYGYSTLNGLRYIASLDTREGYMPWAKYITIASEGIKSFDKFYSCYKSFIPISITTNGDLVPEFLRTTNRDYNSKTMLWMSVVDKIRYPVLVRGSDLNKRIEFKKDENTFNTNAVTYSINLEDANEDREELVESNIGITVFGPATIGLDLASFRTAVNSEELDMGVTEINSLLAVRFLSERIRNALSSPEGYNTMNTFLIRYQNFLTPFINEMFTSINEAASAPSTKNKATSRYFFISFIRALFLLKDEKNMSTNGASAYDHIAMFLQEITQRDVLELLEGPLEKEVVLELAKSTVIDSRDSTVDGLNPSTRATQRNALFNSNVMRGTELNRNGVRDFDDNFDMTAWRNSRLSFSPSSWSRSIHKNGIDSISLFNASLVRAANPSNPLNTLGITQIVVDDAALEQNVRQALYDNLRLVYDTFTELFEQVDKTGPSIHTFGALRSNYYSDMTRAQKMLNEAKLYSSSSNWYQTNSAKRLPPELEEVSNFVAGIVTLDSKNVSSAQGPRLIAKKWMRARLVEAEEISSEPEKWMTRGLLLADVDRRNVIALLNKGVAPWFCSILLVRSFETFLMGSGLWASGGFQTAFFGWNYEQAIAWFTPDAERWDFKYATWLNAVLVNDNALLWRHNIVLLDYFFGRDTKPILGPQDIPKFSDGGMNGYQKMPGSIIYMNVGGEMTMKDLPKPFSITGRLNQGDYPQIRVPEGNEFMDDRLQTPIFFYLCWFGFHKYYQMARVDPYTFRLRQQQNKLNTDCLPGDALAYSEKDMDFTLEIHGESHMSGFGHDRALKLNALNRSSVIQQVPYEKSKI